jgi:hypothetical protein
MKKIILILILFVAIKTDLKAQTSLYDKDTLAVNPVFRKRVKSATVIAANELAADTTQPSYMYVYCNQIITNPDGGWISGMAYQVTANPAISYSSSDNDIQFAVNSNMDKCARAFGNVLPPQKVDSASVQHAGINTVLRPLAYYH